MTRLKRFLTIFVFIFLNISVASAADYYVSTTGSDTNNGLSVAQAWRTIQHAANTVNAGDTVHVLAGTYNEQVTISRSGTAGSPIIFQGEGMPTITYTDNNILIYSSYVTITGFKIIAKGTGVQTTWGSGAVGINISNNYISIDSGWGILFDENSGSNSVISNNEIYTGSRAGIIISTSSATIVKNITITNNTICADRNFLNQNVGDASGIWTPATETNFENYKNFTISYNKILCSAYTAIKISGTGHSINYNEVGPKGFVHNAIEITQSDTELIGNRVYDTDTLWAMYTNYFYGAGQLEDKNFILKDNLVENTTGRGMVLGGHQHDILVENFTLRDFKGVGIEVMGYEHSLYPLPVYSSDDMIFVNITMDNIDIVGGGDHPISIEGLGTRAGGYRIWTRDENTFINVKITGPYSTATWWLVPYTAYDADKGVSFNHFEGSVYVINSNKDDVLISKNPGDTFDGEIIFYYYADVQVVDTNGNPVDVAKVSFAASDPTIKAKNLNYTYEPFPGTTQNISYTYTGINGHTPLPSNANNTVAIADFKQTISGKTYYTWTITAEKDGFTNSTVVNPDSSWYRSDPNTHQNIVTIVLPITNSVGNISGIVTDQTSGAPIVGATVTDGVKTDTTDALGNYFLANLPADSRTVTASKTGYQTTSKIVTVVENSTATADFQLVPIIPPAITSYSPANLTPSQDEGTTNTFNVTVNQPVTSKWFLDGIQQAENSQSYIKTWSFTDAGTRNVTYSGENANGTVSKTWIVTVNNVPDTTPPVITNVASSSITSSSAIITWTTDEPATSQVEYGPTIGYGSTTALDSSLVTSHSVTLTGLNNNTLYHYRVMSKDLDDNQNISNDYSFTTLPISTGTAGLWHFDEGAPSTTVSDSSGNNNHGTISGATWTTGKLGSALQFNGNAYVTVPNSASLNPASEITIEAWFKPAALPQPGWNKIVAKPYTSQTSPYQEYALTLVNDQAVFELNAGGTKSEVFSTVTLASNTWYHIAGIYNGSVMKIYINGELNGTLSKSGAIANYPTDVHIGAGIYSDSSTEYINGTIDEVKILNKALSAAEVKADYDAGTPTLDATPSASIASLQNKTYEQTYINWTWSDPLDADFSKVMVYLNGSFVTNVTKGVQFYNATGLTNDTSYTISTHTVDTSGNVNQTWRNHTAITAPAPAPSNPDVNLDGFVDIADLVIVGQHFGETTTSPYPRYDVNSDGKVNILDITLVASKI